MPVCVAVPLVAWVVLLSSFPNVISNDAFRGYPIDVDNPNVLTTPPIYFRVTRTFAVLAVF